VVEPLTVNQLVAGSNPVLVLIFIYIKIQKVGMLIGRLSVLGTEWCRFKSCLTQKKQQGG
jgi:hypothetical protein